MLWNDGPLQFSLYSSVAASPPFQVARHLKQVNFPRRTDDAFYSGTSVEAASTSNWIEHNKGPFLVPFTCAFLGTVEKSEGVRNG